MCELTVDRDRSFRWYLTNHGHLKGGIDWAVGYGRDDTCFSVIFTAKYGTVTVLSLLDAALSYLGGVPTFSVCGLRSNKLNMGGALGAE